MNKQKISNRLLAMLVLAGLSAPAMALKPADPVTAASTSSPMITSAPEAPSAPAYVDIDGGNKIGSKVQELSNAQVRYQLKKIQTETDKLDAAPASTQGGPIINPSSMGSMNNLRQSPQMQPMELVSASAGTSMIASAIYSLGGESYAEILVNGNKVIAKQGTELSNGYRVTGVTSAGVSLIKGKSRSVLPVTPGQAAPGTYGYSTGSGSMGYSGNSAAFGGANYNSLTGGNAIIPAQAGPGGGLPPMPSSMPR